MSEGVHGEGGEVDPSTPTRDRLILPPAPPLPEPPRSAAATPTAFTWCTSASRGITYAVGVSVARSDPQAVERMRPLYDGAYSPTPLPTPPIRARPCVCACCGVSGGESFAAIGRATQHDWRTVRDVLLGSGRHHGHGGRRRDVLGDRGRELLYKLIRLAPKGRSRWYARCMSKMLKKMVKPGVITNAWLNFRFSRHAMTVLYSECALARPSHTMLGSPPLPHDARKP